MKKNELEHRLAEVAEMRAIIEKTLNAAIDDAKKSEQGRDEALRILGEVINFSKEILESVQRANEQDRQKHLESAFQKLRTWATAEGDRIKIRPQFLQERVAALQSVTGFLVDRLHSHEARIAAIDRAADPARDKKHPEKLSVRRASQQLSEDDEE